MPPSVEGALLGTEDRQSRPIKERLELILFDRARMSSLQYGLFQAGAGGACVPSALPFVRGTGRRQAFIFCTKRIRWPVLRSIEPDLYY